MRPDASRIVALGAVAVGAALGVAVVAVPATTLPLALELLLLLGFTLVLLRHEREAAARRWLTGLVIAGLAVRLGLALVIHFRFSPYVLAPDAATYEYYGAAIRDYWLGERSNVGRIAGTWQTAYHYVNGFFFYAFGEGPLGPVVLNMFLSLWSGVLAYRLGVRLADRRTAEIVSGLVIFFPSLMLWSVLNIRDAGSTFLVVATVLAATEARRLRSLGHGLVALLLLILLSSFRDYMGFLVGVGLLLGLLLSLRPERIGGTLVAAAPIVVALVLFSETLGLLQRFPETGPLETLSSLRADLTTRAGSAFARETTYETAGQALRFLPRGIAYFLFAPFPWALRGPLQMAAAPETLLWYALVPATLAGVRRCLRERRTGLFTVLGVGVVVLVAYGLVEGNIGTAYRHRAQIMPLLFLFTALGLAHGRRPLSRSSRTATGPSSDRVGSIGSGRP